MSRPKTSSTGSATAATAAADERVPAKSFVVLIVGTSKSNHLHARGNFEKKNASAARGRPTQGNTDGERDGSDGGGGGCGGDDGGGGGIDSTAEEVAPFGLKTEGRAQFRVNSICIYIYT